MFELGCHFMEELAVKFIVFRENDHTLCKLLLIVYDIFERMLAHVRLEAIGHVLFSVALEIHEH